MTYSPLQIIDMAAAMLPSIGGGLALVFKPADDESVDDGIDIMRGDVECRTSIQLGHGYIGVNQWNATRDAILHLYVGPDVRKALRVALEAARDEATESPPAQAPEWVPGRVWMITLNPGGAERYLYCSSAKALHDTWAREIAAPGLVAAKAEELDPASGEPVGVVAEWPMPLNQPRAFLALPVDDLESGKAWLRALRDAGCEYHLDDDPAEIFDLNKCERLFSPDESNIVRDRVAELRGLDWGVFDCPIGYLLHLQGLDEPDQYVWTLLDELQHEATDWQKALGDGGRPSLDSILARIGMLQAHVAARPVEPKPVFAILYGGPVGGFKAHGPFATKEDANEWAEEMGEGGDWTLAIHPVTAESCQSLYPIVAERGASA